MGNKGGGPTEEEGVNRSTTLPIFPESNLPSAKQLGLVIGIVDSNGDVWVGISTGIEWRKTAVLDLKNIFTAAATFQEAVDFQKNVDFQGQDSFANMPTVDDRKIDSFGGHLLHVQDQKASGTLGGGFTSGAWRTRDQNTILTNEITGASLASNQITLPAGTYYIEASAPAWRVRRHMVRLQDIGGSTSVLHGSSEYSDPDGTGAVTRSWLFGRFTLSGQATIEIQHRCQTTRTTNGFGIASGRGFTVDHETYADARIWKIG